LLLRLLGHLLSLLDVVHQSHWFSLEVVAGRLTLTACIRLGETATREEAWNRAS
jgi:hypothetical protein